jgi:hypothetical protein
MTFFASALLPFWIRGVPFVAAIISYLRLPGHDDIVRQSQRRGAAQPHSV